VESLDDEQSLGEDASKQGRIWYIDADEGITLVSTQDDAKMFDADKDLGGEEVFVEKDVADKEEIDEDKGKAIMVEKPMKLKKKDQIRLDEEAALRLQAELQTELQAECDEEQRLKSKKAQKELETNIALIETWHDVQAKIDVDYQLAERLQAEEQDEFTDAEKATLFVQLSKKRRKFNRVGARRMERKESRRRAGKKVSKKQKIDDDKETTKIKHLMEIILDEEKLATNAIPLAVKSPKIVDWKIHKEGKKSYYQIMRADEKSNMYMFFSKMLESFDREDLEDLYKLGRIVRIKSLLDAVGITAAHAFVNTAQD
nr:hypothetical protein [Tanacetum cinerariifolium]